MNKLLKIGGVLAVSAALAGPARAEVVINQTVDVDIDVFVPCANGGAGELVSLSGPLHILTTFVLNGNQVSGKSHLQPQGISGVGLETGDKYQATGVTQDHFSGSLTNGQFNQSFINNFKIIGEGPGNNFLVHENFHLSINANGEVTTAHDNFYIVCQ